jgi:prophage tail gpP-like protein
MIEVVINGTPYVDFVSNSVTVSLSSVANDFTAVASAVNGFPPLKVNDTVEIRVDDVLVLTGWIDEMSGADQEEEHLVTYTGRDKTGDFIDSQINVMDDIKAGPSLTLKRIIELVIAHLGTDLKVVDLVDSDPFNEAEDILAPKVGQKALEFVAVYAAKRQSLLSSNGEGNLVITQSQPTDSGAVVQRLSDADDNNILSQKWQVNGSQLFNKYIDRGQLDPKAFNFSGSFSSSAVSNQEGGVVDGAVREGRQWVKVRSKSYSSEQLKNLSKWSKQLAAAKATRFTCVVRGHQMPQGGLWVANTLVQVNSDVADINRKMLLDTTTFMQGEGRPTATRLEFVEANVYTIDEKIRAQRPVGSMNDIFKSLG